MDGVFVNTGIAVGSADGESWEMVEGMARGFVGILVDLAMGKKKDGDQVEIEKG